MPPFIRGRKERMEAKFGYAILLMCFRYSADSAFKLLFYIEC